LLALVGCVTAILATTGRTSTSAQARLAALPAVAPAPADNPSTPDRVALGRLLFWDPILSGQKDVACATCHHPLFGYSDGLDLSLGANGAGSVLRERSFRDTRRISSSATARPS
jgi:cytochrome c peroxidase